MVVSNFFTFFVKFGWLVFRVVALVNIFQSSSSIVTPALETNHFWASQIPLPSFPIARGISYNGEQPTVFCPNGFMLTKSSNDSKAIEICVKLVPARSWNDAMSTCFTNYYLAKENFPPDYDISWWLRNVSAFLESNRPFPEFLLWLPAKRRVPGGPLYPHFLPNNWHDPNSSKTWDIPAIHEEIISSRHNILDTGHLCLAWYTHNRTLTTRSCSENLSTLCMTIPRNVSLKNFEVAHPVEYGLSECIGMDYFVPNHLGVNSCYKIIVAGSDTSGFSWEEAELQCKEVDPQATLALLTPHNAGILHLVRKNRGKSDRLWISIEYPRTIFPSTRKSLIDAIRAEDTDSNSTTLMPGVIARTTEDNGSLFVSELREAKLREALCQVDFKFRSNFNQVTYYLTVSWKDSTRNYFSLRMITQEIAKVTDYKINQMKMRNWKIVHDHLHCFANGILIKLKGMETKDSKFELSAHFSVNFTSFFCESFTLDGTFLRSNTLLWPSAATTFVVLGSVRRNAFPIKQEGQHGNKTYGSSIRETEKLGGINSQNLTTKSNIFHYGNWFTWKNCTLSDPKYDSVLESLDEHKTSKRYYILCNNTARNLSTAYNQVRDAVAFLSEEVNKMSPVYQVTAIRGMTKCMQDVIKLRFVNLTFPETPIGGTTFSRERCAQKYGALLQRTCLGDIYHGAYWGPVHAWTMENTFDPFPSSVNCSDQSETTLDLLGLFGDSKDFKYMLSELRNITKTWTEPTIADLQLTALLLESLTGMNIQLEKMDLLQCMEITEQVLSVNPEILGRAQLSNIASTVLKALVNLLLHSTNDSSHSITSFSTNISFFATKINDNASEILCTAHPNKFNHTEIAADIVKLPNTVYNVTTQPRDVALKLKIPSQPSFNDTSSFVAVVYHRTVQLVNAATMVGRNTTVYAPKPSDADDEILLTNYIAHGPMVQVALTAGGATLSKPLQIFFRPPMLVHFSHVLNNSLCVSWNPQINGWSTRGCQLLDSLNGFDVCECDHLSTFTILHSYKHAVIVTNGGYDMLVLIGTTIGCGLSLFGLLGVMATYAMFPKWREPQPKYYGHHIIFHCSLALTALVLTFMTGIELTGSLNICLIVAVLLHYFTLTVFFWMLVRAYYNYLLFVKVWAVKTSRFMLKAALFAWGLPLLMPCAAILINSHFYQYTNHANYCWLSPEGFNYFLLPFVALIGVLNMVLYVIISVKLCCVRKELRSTQNGKQTLTNYAALGVAFIVGFILIFALVATVEDRTFFSYLFVLFTSLQGLVIFFFYIYRGKTAREQWKNFFRGKSNREQAQEKVTANIFRGKPNLRSIRSLIKSGSTQCSSQKPETP